MKPQKPFLKLMIIPIIITILLSSILVSPTVSAQEEPPDTPTEFSTEEPVVDNFPEPTPQPTLEDENEAGEVEGFQPFSIQTVTTPSPADPDCSDGRCVFIVSSNSDDAGLHPNCTYSTSANEIYMGECTNGQPITSGFRFQNINLPPGTIIHNAYIEFTLDGPYTDELNVVFYGENSGNASTFSNTNRPSNRFLTTSSVPWFISSDESWSLDQIQNTPSLTPIIQEIINRPDWVQGNSIAIILKNVGPSSGTFKHRRVIAYDRFTSTYGVTNAARLVIDLYGCTPDVYEPDNDSSTSSVITAGEEQTHSLCPENDEDWVKVDANSRNILIETFNLSPEITPLDTDTQITLLEGSNQIGVNQDRGLGPNPGSGISIKSSRLVWNPAVTTNTYDLQIEQQITSDEKEYGLRLVTPFALVDPVDQATWGPTKTSITTVTRYSNVLYITQYFTFDQAQLDALNEVPATLAWEFRRPDVDENGVEISNSIVDYGDYWRSINGICAGEYYTNLPSHSDRFVEEYNWFWIPGCEPNNPTVPQSEEFELYIDKPSKLVAGTIYFITIKFHVHDNYLNSDYQFYISKVEYCELLGSWDVICNLRALDLADKFTANLIEGYLQPAP
jgi:hypothetical protein